MDREKMDKIRDAVKANFDRSPLPYQEFENATGFFRTLNEALLAFMEIPDHAKILDVGCGTGASSMQMLDRIPSCRVWGLDISPGMLQAARDMVGESDRVRFVEGDGGRLGEYFKEKFDAVVYSASIFLIPDYLESLRQARALLEPGGCIGLTFMDGMYGPDGENLVLKANEQAHIGVSVKRPVRVDVFLVDIGKVFPEHRVRVRDFMESPARLIDFYSVPAMSAGLFPGLPYEQRARKVRELFDFLGDIPICFRWQLVTGTTPK